MTGASPKISSTGFALGIFNQSTHDLNRFAIVYERDHSVSKQSWALFDLGCVLEERLLLAQGALSGVFPPALVRDWLRRDDELLHRVDFGAFGSNADRLPQYLDADELLREAHGAESKRQDVENFLLFRKFENRPSNDPPYQQLQSDVLFASADRWKNELDSISQAATNFSRGDERSIRQLSNAYSWILASSQLLETVNGAAMNSSDPWGIVPEVDRFVGTYPELARLSKMDGRASERIKLAVESAQATEAVDDERQHVNEQYIRDYFLLRLFQYARMPRELLIDPFRQEVRLRILSLSTISARYDSSIVRALGPSWSWAASLWRTAPPDERSILRMQQVVSLVAQGLDSAVRNEEQ